MTGQPPRPPKVVDGPSTASWRSMAHRPRSLAAARVNGDLRELLGTLRAFAIPMRTKFRGITVARGALIQGPAGWGEFSPFAEYGPRESARWLASAIESATVPWPAPVRDRCRST